MIFPADSGFGRLKGCCSALCGVLNLWAFLSGLVSRLRRERAGQQPETVELITRRPPPARPRGSTPHATPTAAACADATACTCTAQLRAGPTGFSSPRVSTAQRVRPHPH